MTDYVEMSSLERFRQRLPVEWALPFCTARAEHGFSSASFVEASLAGLGEDDARDFMGAIDEGLVHHHDGTFVAPCSKAKEQIFWSGRRRRVPRTFTLWLEPIITIAALKRLSDIGWPRSRLGLQSVKPWRFDLVGYAADQRTEQLVCEVKKSSVEADKLVQLMTAHLKAPAVAESHLTSVARNAFRKVCGLRDSVCTVLWVLGPNQHEYVFNVVRDSKGSLALHRTERLALRPMASAQVA